MVLKTEVLSPTPLQCIMRERPRKYLVEQSRTVGRQKEARKSY